MTDRELLQMALDALEHGLPIIEDFGGKEQLQIQYKAISALYEALRAALVQPEQEPVAWVAKDESLNNIAWNAETGMNLKQNTPLYTAPGAAGSVVAMTQDKGVKLTFTQHPEILAVDEDADVNPDSLETIEIDLPEPKPVAWMDEKGILWNSVSNPDNYTALYTAPPKKEWVGFTQEDHQSALFKGGSFGAGFLYAEKLLKEKNI